MRSLLGAFVEFVKVIVGIFWVFRAWGAVRGA